MHVPLPSKAAAAVFLFLSLAGAGAAVPVQIHTVPGGVRLTWDPDGAGYLVEEASSLGPGTRWQPSSATPIPDGVHQQVTLTATDAHRFFRLRSTPLARILEMSPRPGEDGVAVTRETILRLSAPLAPSVALSTEDLFAEAGGRRILSRVSVSSDRQTITLFYLEPLPATARVRVTIRGEKMVDEIGRPVDVDGNDVAGGNRFLDFDTLAIKAVENTAVVGTVFASELATGPDGIPHSINQPLAGVTISVDGAEETLRTTTDAQGRFKLQPAPAGRFFVHVDGRTAPASHWPNGDYYPVVGKAWEAVAGREDNKAVGTGEIFLPLVPAGTLQPVSQTVDTPITFPAAVIAAKPFLDGVSITVPANSLYADAGSRGGRVGIAPVPPDRLPEPLPPGLSFPLVITVQTDGPQNFDRPVPVRFPNLPDPATGKPLDPGAHTALWSFSHDTGQWEIQGPMTVTEDGRFVVSDPGVGIRQPGWHGTQPGTPCDGNPPVNGPGGGGGSGGGGGGGGPGNPPKPNPCEGITGDEATKLAYEGVKNALECASDLAKVKGAMLCLRNLIKASAELMSGLTGLLEGLQANPPTTTVEQAKNFIATAKPIKDTMVTLAGCEESANPAHTAEAAFNCLGNALSFLQTLCDAEKSKTGEPPECKLGPTSTALCGLVDRLKLAHAEAAALLAYIKDFEDKFALTTTCLALNQLDVLVNAISTANQPPVPGLADGAYQPLTPAQADALLVSAKSVLTAAQRIGLNAALEPAADGIDRILAADIDVMTAAPDLLHDHFATSKGTLLYRLSTDTLVRRGVTTAQGTFREILPPETFYRLEMYDPAANTYGATVGFTASAGKATVLSPVVLESAAGLADADGDGLPDLAEAVAGTDAHKADTDGDSLTDLAEMLQGTDPLGGLPAVTGIIGTAPAPGNALDVAVMDDLAAVALDHSGVALYLIPRGQNPKLLARVATPDRALGVALAPNRIVVANGNAGLAIVDISDPPAARILRQIPIDAGIQCVDAAGEVCYAGSTSGRIYVAELAGGTPLLSRTVGEPVQDLKVVGSHLYVLTDKSLRIYERDSLQELGSAGSPGVVNTAHGRKRLFVGGGIAYAVNTRGYNTLSVSNPAAPALLQSGITPQFGWKQIVLNGSGLGLATVSPNQAFDGPHNLSLYNITDPLRNDDFIGEFVTPGVARSVAVNKGLAYVADNTEGLQVINYLPYDNKGVAPSVRVEASFPLNPAATVEEGRPAWIRAEVADDVQVRDVEFHFNGERFGTDGSYPFEYHFTTPRLSVTNRFTFRVRATDTGGNSTWSPEVTVNLVPDNTPPVLTALTPAENEVVLTPTPVMSAVFDSLMDPASLDAARFQLVSGGPDGLLDTADDIVGVAATRTFLPSVNVALLTQSTALPNNQYRLMVRAGVQDLAGNPLGHDVVRNFRVSKPLPFVTSTTPGSGTVVGQIIRTVTIRFNEPMSPLSLAGNTFELFGAGPDGVSGTPDDLLIPGGKLSLSASGTEATYTFPDLVLLDGKYRAVLHKTASDAVAGNGLASDHAWLFTIKKTPPQLASATPLNSEIVASVRPLIRATFDGPMLAASLTPATFQLRGAGPDGIVGNGDDTAVDGTSVVIADDARSASLSLATAPLRNGKYSVRLTTGVKDISGNPLAAAIVWSFVVRETSVPAWVSSTPAPLDQLPSGPSLVTAVFSKEMDEASFATAGRFILTSAGPDGLLNTLDDQPVASGTPVRGISGVAVTLPLASPLVPGRYLATVGSNVTDVAGNNLAADATWSFSVDRVTDLRGRVALANGTPLAGATVRAAGTTVTSDSLGLFRVPALGLPPTGDLVITAAAAPDLLGRSATLIPAHQGVTDAGTVVLNTTCVEQFAAGEFTPAGADGPIRVFGVHDSASGPTLYAALRPATSPTEPLVDDVLVRWDGRDWRRVPALPAVQGMPEVFRGTITAIASYKGELYVAGNFTTMSGVVCNSIAHWDGTRWAGAGTGVTYTTTDGERSAYIYSLAVFDAGAGPELFVGGTFERAGGIPSFHIARWNGTQWSAVGGITTTFNVGGSIQALQVFDDGHGAKLYGAGTFDIKTGSSSQNVARWTGTTWEKIGGGVKGKTAATYVQVTSLVAMTDTQGPALYAGGTFTVAGTANLAVNGLARWDGTAWSNVGGGVRYDFGGGQPTPGNVQALAVAPEPGGQVLYVAGGFNSAGSTPAEGVARWTGAAWTSLGQGDAALGIAPGVDAVTALRSFDDGTGRRLFVGGSFHNALVAQAGGAVVIPARYAALWNGTDWRPAGTGLDGPVDAVMTRVTGANAGLFAAGDFHYAGGVPARGVAWRVGDTWQPLGAGVPGAGKALAEFAGHVFAGGDFNEDPNAPEQGLFEWDGQQWIAPGGGIQGKVSSLATLDGLYAAGTFTKAGSITAFNIARWDGKLWSPVGNGAPGTPQSLIVHDDGSGPAVFLGAFNGVHKWNRQRWTQVAPTTPPGNIVALATHDDGGGVARLFALNSDGRLLRLEGDQWIGLSPIGTAPPLYLNQDAPLTSFDDGLGARLLTGGPELSQGFVNNFSATLAEWDGSAWSLLPAALSDPSQVRIRVLHPSVDTTGPVLYVGGTFATAGGHPSPFLAKWRRPAAPCPTPP